MKKYYSFYLTFMIITPAYVFTQNVGIGTFTPTRAKLEVYGTAGTGYTSAIFGSDGAGISLERNWPSIGFNQYNDGNGRYMSTGYAAIQYFNPSTGEMALDMLGSGQANAPTNIIYPGLTVNKEGNVGIRSGAYSAITLFVPKIVSNIEGSLVIGGTQWNSHFSYSTTEDTYIRPGKSNGKVIINDVPGGKVVMGNGNTKVGINSSNPAYSLEIYQAPAGGGIILVSSDWYYTNWKFKNEVYSNTGHTSCLQLVYNANSIKGWFRPDNGQYSANSDRRLKRNLVSMEPILDKVLALRATRYEMMDNNPEKKNP